MTENERTDEVREIKENLLHHTRLLIGHLTNLYLSSENQQKNIMYIRTEINTIITKLSSIDEDCPEETEEEIGICIEIGKKFAILTERDSILNERSSIDEWATKINALKLIPSDSPREREDEEKLITLAKKGLNTILKLSDSQLVSEKLQAFNMLLFVFISTICMTYFFVGTNSVDLSFLAMMVLSFIFSLVAILGYGPLLFAVTNISTKKIQSLRIGISILFVALTSSIASFILNMKLFMNLSLALMFFQLIVILTSGFFIPEPSIKDVEINSNQLWANLGRVSSIVGIISFLLDIGLILYSFR